MPPRPSTAGCCQTMSKSGNGVRFLCATLFYTDNRIPLTLSDCSNISADDMLYTETDLEESMDKIETINFHEVKEVAGIKFWCYHAGHVLGAAMFMIEIAGVKVTSVFFVDFLFFSVFYNDIHKNAFFFCFSCCSCCTQGTSPDKKTGI